MESTQQNQLSSKKRIILTIIGLLDIAFSIALFWFSIQDINYIPYPNETEHVTASVLKVNKCTPIQSKNHNGVIKDYFSCDAHFQYLYHDQYYTFRDTIQQKVSSNQQIDLVINTKDPSLYLFKDAYHQFYLILLTGCFFFIAGILLVIRPPKLFHKLFVNKTPSKEDRSSDPTHGEIEDNDNPSFMDSSH